MKFQIHCPHCEVKLQVDSDWSGKRMRCSSCGGELVVPEATGAAPKPKRQAGKSKAIRQGKRGAARPRAGAGAGAGAGRAAKKPADDLFPGTGEVRFTTSQPRRADNIGKWMPPILGLLVLGFLVWFVYSYMNRDKESMFDKPEEQPTVCTQADMVAWLRLDLVAREKLQTMIETRWKTDLEGREGRKWLKTEFEPRMETWRTYFRTGAKNHCDEYEEADLDAAVEQVLGEWISTKERDLEAAGVPTGAAKREAKEAKEAADPGSTDLGDEGLSAADKGFKKLDRDARKEIREFLETVEVPSDYSGRAQWLVGELVTLRREANKGYELADYAYRVARVEELFAKFDEWAKPTDRGHESFQWLLTTMKTLKLLRDNWRDASIGRNPRFSEDKVTENMANIVHMLDGVEKRFRP